MPLPNDNQPVRLRRLDLRFNDDLRAKFHDILGDADHAEHGSLDVSPSSSVGPTPSEPAADSSSRSAKRKAPSKLRKQKKRAALSAKYPGIPHPTLTKKYMTLNIVSVDLDVDNLTNSAKGAFVSQSRPGDISREWTLDELTHRGFRVVGWDGRTPTIIVDQQDRIITILAGRPRCDDWDLVHEQMSARLQRAGNEVESHKEQKGGFVSLSTGVSHAGTRICPGNLILVHKPSNQAIIDDLCQDRNFVRASGFMNSLSFFYTPKLYAEYTDYLNKFFSNNPHLKKPFEKSIFPACTFNYGPHTLVLEHIGSTDISSSLCAIISRGSYDPKKGGHLVLSSLSLVVQFPPGSTILVPSGIIHHGDVAIQPNETKQSFTHYFPGGLFDDPHEVHCKRVCSLFSKTHELAKDRLSACSFEGPAQT